MSIKVSKERLATLIGVSVAEISERTQKGFFRPMRDAYDLTACCNAYSHELREIAAGRIAAKGETGGEGGEELDNAAWAAALREEQATDARIRREVLEGALLPLDQIVRQIGGAILSARNEIQDAPARLRLAIYNMTSATRLAIEAEARETMTRLVADGAKALAMSKRDDGK